MDEVTMIESDSSDSEMTLSDLPENVKTKLIDMKNNIDQIESIVHKIDKDLTKEKQTEV
jgi:hypothetical protein